MMSRVIYIYVFVIVMCAASVCGCIAEDVVCPSHPHSTEDIELAVSTKALPDADLSERLSVKDIWLFQFGGSSDDSELVGSPVYMDYQSDPIEEGDQTRLVSLVTSSQVNTIVVIANTHDPDLKWSVPTLAYMKQASESVTGSEDNWSSGEKDLIMSGFASATIAAGDALEVELEFNAAKVEFELVNTPGSGMTLHSVTMADVPDCSFYAQDLIPSGTLSHDVRIDYPETDAVSGDKYFWYVPRDDQGLVHIRVLSTDGDGIAYRYKIPVDVSGVESGHRYPLSLTISDVGDPYLDGSVEKYGEVELENANCFIVHPYPAGGVTDGQTLSRRFSIPVSQVNAYWKDIRHDDARCLSAMSEWTVEILWQDVPDLVTLITTSGKGPNQRILFSVANGTYGNAVIALKKGDEILWSWHVWSTDYDPEYHSKPLEKKYIYPVDGGFVHRYGGDFWEPSANGTDAFVATYREKYIMDRNLGASSPENTGLMYQFGRKDPFTDDLLSVVSSKMTMDQTVLTPEVYVKVASNDWCSDMSTFNTWNSPSSYKEGKSIFDPCPAGWKVPHADLWEDFVYTNDSNPANDTVLQSERELAWEQDGVVGLRYWPMGVLMDEPVYYPTGIILTGVYDSSRVGVWSSSSYNSVRGYLMTSNKGASVEKKGTSFRSNAYPIRCVQE